MSKVEICCNDWEPERQLLSGLRECIFRDIWKRSQDENALFLSFWDGPKNTSEVFLGPLFSLAVGAVSQSGEKDPPPQPLPPFLFLLKLGLLFSIWNHGKLIKSQLSYSTKILTTTITVCHILEPRKEEREKIGSKAWKCFYSSTILTLCHSTSINQCIFTVGKSSHYQFNRVALIVLAGSRAGSKWRI